MAQKVKSETNTNHIRIFTELARQTFQKECYVTNNLHPKPGENINAVGIAKKRKKKRSECSRNSLEACNSGNVDFKV